MRDVLDFEPHAAEHSCSSFLFDVLFFKEMFYAAELHHDSNGNTHKQRSLSAFQPDVQSELPTAVYHQYLYIDDASED